MGFGWCTPKKTTTHLFGVSMMIRKMTTRTTTRLALSLVLVVSVVDVRWAAGQTLADDRAALVSFRAGVSDPDNRLANWGVGSDPCVVPWHGVGCMGNRVTSVSLRSEKLSGQGATSLDHLTNLTQLVTLDVSSNDFTGAVPDVCGGGTARCAATVTHVILSGNLLNGSLPVDFGGCASLSQYNAADNRITGEIPALGSNAQPVRALEHLNLGRNKITGTIPDSLGLLAASLKTLRLEGCRLRGAPRLRRGERGVGLGVSIRRRGEGSGDAFQFFFLLSFVQLFLVPAVKE